MGLDNRDYARDTERGFQLHAPQTMIGTLILVNVAVWVLDMLADGRISQTMALSTDVLRRPWNCWQLLTYGFLHSQTSLLHIVGNMFGLWFFGSDLENIYGKREFLRIYLVAIVIAGLAWLGIEAMSGGGRVSMVGASGAVTCVTVLYALRYPYRTILVMGILPVPVWLLATLFVMQDMAGAYRNVHGAGNGVAYVAHLGGAGLALFYFHFGWNFGRWVPQKLALPSLPKMFARGPKLKLHEPTVEQPPSLEAEMDRILVKINETSFDSLTPEERRTLERASARFQKRRQ
ncbi:MAG: rhomboid family intramembrane serine protease [Planctomycetia bacterium]|nr:rhomboid family intramembrane serine protease [Planctomycetia bacterium]